MALLLRLFSLPWLGDTNFRKEQSNTKRTLPLPLPTPHPHSPKKRNNYNQNKTSCAVLLHFASFIYLFYYFYSLHVWILFRSASSLHRFRFFNFVLIFSRTVPMRCFKRNMAIAFVELCLPSQCLLCMLQFPPDTSFEKAKQVGGIFCKVSTTV